MKLKPKLKKDLLLLNRKAIFFFKLSFKEVNYIISIKLEQKQEGKLKLMELIEQKEDQPLGLLVLMINSSLVLCLGFLI